MGARTLRGILAVALLVGAAASPPPATPTGTSKNPAFLIKAAASRLFPGGTRPVTLRLSNPLSEWLEITSVEVEDVASDPSRPGCDPELLSATSWSGSIELPPHSSRVFAELLTVTLDAGAPDDCQGARFGLHLQGTGAWG